MILRFLPKRTLLAALVTTALIFAVYYAWNPPARRPTAPKAAQFQEEDGGGLLPAPLKTSPAHLESKVAENASSRNYLVAPPEVVEPEAQCRPLPLKVAAMETADIYPKLNFNVSRTFLVIQHFLIKVARAGSEPPRSLWR
jgi:hypothetical protein